MKGRLKTQFSDGLIIKDKYVFRPYPPQVLFYRYTR